MSRRLFHIIAALLTLLSMTLMVPAAALAGEATDVVREKQTKLFKLIGGPSTPAVEKEIGQLFDEMLDYEGLAKASLGDEWAKRTEAEQKEFSGLLKQLVQRAYQKNLKKTLNFDIRYLGEEKAKSGGTKVQTKATPKNDDRGETIEINYEMHKVGDKYQVGDIETEGVSLVKSYKNQFSKILKKHDWPTLVSKMKEKVAKGE